MFKVNGLRIHLQEMFPEDDFACIHLYDAVLGEHYSVAPRTLHRLESLPRGDAGKVQVDYIIRSLNQSMDLSRQSISNMPDPVTEW